MFGCTTKHLDWTILESFLPQVTRFLCLIPCMNAYGVKKLVVIRVHPNMTFYLVNFTSKTGKSLSQDKSSTQTNGVELSRVSLSRQTSSKECCCSIQIFTCPSVSFPRQANIKKRNQPLSCFLHSLSPNSHFFQLNFCVCLSSRKMLWWPSTRKKQGELAICIGQGQKEFHHLKFAWLYYFTGGPQSNLACKPLFHH